MAVVVCNSGAINQGYWAHIHVASRGYEFRGASTKIENYFGRASIHTYAPETHVLYQTKREGKLIEIQLI